MASMATCFRLLALKFLHKTPSFPPLSSPLLNHCPFPRKFTVRAFSATMSPPSTAVVYEEHGPPDDVTKSSPIPLPFYYYCQYYFNFENKTLIPNFVYLFVFLPESIIFFLVQTILDTRVGLFLFKRRQQNKLYD